MEARSMVHRVMTVKPSVKRRRADQEDDAKNSHWKKRMIERAEDENLKIGRRRILKDLIAHSRMWAFSEPPEVMIPRDLAAVEGKLEQNIYSDAKEFVDDVRLAFKNAKPYSPRWAAVLDANFTRQWKLLEAKINKVTKKDDRVHVVGTCNGQDSKEDDSTSSSSSSSSCIVDVVSPEKALRAAMLKTRFADTINKATQTLFPDKKSDLPRKIQQEINSKELKRRRERERRALEEIERKADVDSTAAALKMLFGPTGYPSPEPLQRIGLYIINDDQEEQDGNPA